MRLTSIIYSITVTPLMLDNPTAFSLFDPKRDTLLPPEELARAMMSLVIDTDKYKAGTILEVCEVEGRWRELLELNDPGLQGPASRTSGGKEVVNDIFRTLHIGPKI